MILIYAIYNFLKPKVMLLDYWFSFNNIQKEKYSVYC